MRRLMLISIAALALIVIASGCGDAGSSASPGALPSQVTTATIVSSPVPSPSAATPSPGAPAGATPTPAGTAAPAERVASTAATPTDELPVVVFERTDGSTVSLAVEVPPRSDYQIGLSGRTALDGRGMLFYYPGGAGNAGFWMSHTHIDLAIAFVTVDGVISEIDEMTAESLEITRPDEPYEFAIEAPSGWYAAHGVMPGDAMRLEFDVTDFVE